MTRKLVKRSTFSLPEVPLNLANTLRAQKGLEASIVRSKGRRHAACKLPFPHLCIPAGPGSTFLHRIQFHSGFSILAYCRSSSDTKWSVLSLAHISLCLAKCSACDDWQLTLDSLSTSQGSFCSVDQKRALQLGNTMRPRRDSNPQSSDPKSDALSIRPRGRSAGFATPFSKAPEANAPPLLPTHCL